MSIRITLTVTDVGGDETSFIRYPDDDGRVVVEPDRIGASVALDKVDAAILSRFLVGDGLPC